MFERFTARARQIVVLAQDEARAYNNHEIDVCHLVAAMIREDQGMAARVLDSLGFTLEEAREKYPKGADEVATGQIPMTATLRRTLDLALREALSLGHNYIGTEHLLLGVIRQTGGLMNVDGEVIRHEVMRLLVGPGRKEEAEQSIRRALPAAEQQAFEKGVGLTQELLEHGFQVTLTTFGAQGSDGRVRKPRFRINVTNGDSIAHDEFLELVQRVDEREWAVEFSQKHGLTFRPKSDPDLHPGVPPVMLTATANTGSASHWTVKQPT